MKRSQRLLCQILTLASWFSCATGLASLRISRLKELFSFPGVLPPTPEAAPKLGYVRIAHNIPTSTRDRSFG